MDKKSKDLLENKLASEEARNIFPYCHLVSLDKILDAPNFPLPPICKCDYDIKPLPIPCYLQKTCTMDCKCDMHICTCDSVCPCISKCNHCYCDNKYGKSPIDSLISIGCETHSRTLFRVAK